MDNKTYLLKVLVGSHAHGLARPDSDHDYRGVYVLPTKDILALGYNYKGSHWMEGDQHDATAYEIGHFLQLATKSNPTILEVMVAPVEQSLTTGELQSAGGCQYHWGKDLRDIMQYCWNPKDAYNAFTGYGLNQRKKMLDNHMDRWHKYAVAYIRTLLNLCNLLKTGTFSLMVDSEDMKSYLTSIRNKEVRPGEIIDKAAVLTHMARDYADTCKHEPDLAKVNEFLLKVRKQFWS